MSTQLVPALSEPDADGRRTATWPFPVEMVKGGDEAFVFHETYPLDCSGFSHVTEVATFIGVDRGDIVEAAVDLVSEGGFALYQRSFHKELPGDYDAWEKSPVSYHLDGTLRDGLVLTLTCRVTGRDPDGKLSATIQFECRLTVR
jgi:hypothetical protein